MDLDSSGYILGIDLGTTNSLVGVVDSGFPILLADAQGSRLTPSAVHYDKLNDSVTVGAAALRRRMLEPAQTVTSVKRFMGRRSGESDEVKVAYDLQLLGVDAVQVSSEILKHLKSVAEQALETSVSRAVITVPAYFNDAQRQATKRAGELAGLQVERIVSEPTAAALAYGLDKLEEKKKIAVYDLGGGTFDITILEMRDGVFQVLATAGDTYLGGDDIDRALAAWIWKTSIRVSHGAWEAADPEVRARVLMAAEDAKKKLSSAEEALLELPFLLDGESFQIVIKRTDLEQIAAPWVDRTRKYCLRALADAQVKAEDLDEVILVGGSTRMPLVRERVKKWFGREPNISQNPDEAVALGAVIQAGILSGALRHVVLLDVTPLSLGIETFGGLMNVIIPRNTTIPCKAGEMFTNAVDGQREMLIRVLQGEREMAKDNWELGKIAVPFQAGPKGSARVGVQFSLDANGILQVLTRDTATNSDVVLEIRDAAVDVDDAKVEQMIAESVEYAFDDMNERVWTEAKLKADELLKAIDEALQLCGDGVAEEEVKTIQECAEEVRLLANSEIHDAPKLKEANQKLDDATQSLAVMLVERAMEEAMTRRLGDETD